MKFKSTLYFFILLLCAAPTAFSQVYKISGLVMDTKREPLPLASVEIKDFKIGQTTKDDGSFSFSLERGQYDLVVSMVGFKTKVVTFFITNQDTVENIMLELDDTASLGEIIVRAKYRDRAEEFVRKVVQHKDEHQSAAGNYSCNVYIKATQQDSIDAKKKKEETDSVYKEDFSKMSLAEISIRLDKGNGGNIK